MYPYVSLETCVSSQFVNGRASLFGAALHIQSGQERPGLAQRETIAEVGNDFGISKLFKCSFESNVALNGGAISSVNSAQLTIAHSIFRANTAKAFDCGSLVTYFSFRHWQATGGGMLVVADKYMAVTVSGSTFEANTAVTGAAVSVVSYLQRYPQCYHEALPSDRYGVPTHKCPAVITMQGSIIRNQTTQYQGSGAGIHQDCYGPVSPPDCCLDPDSAVCRVHYRAA